MAAPDRSSWSKSRTCRPATWPAMFNAQGPNANCLTACAASSQAIGEAAEIIRRGDADVMLSGGTHSMIHPFGVTGFNLLTALSTHNDEPDARPRARSTATATASCWAKGPPWSSSKSWSTPRRRGAQIYGEVTGYGSTADAFRITDTHPEGRGAIALHQAGPGRRRPEPRPTSTTSTPTAPAPASTTRSRRWPSRTRLRRARLQDARLQHQEHDGPPDRRRRRHRADHLPAGHPRQRPAADDQLRNARSRVRSGLRPQRGPRRPAATTP